MAVTLTKIPCSSSTPALPALPALPRKNTPSNDHSKGANSLSSLHSNLLPYPFSQPVIHHSLPPRPPAVFPSSTTNRNDDHTSYPNNFDRAFDGLVSATGATKDQDDGVSLICVPAKENSGRTYSHVTLPDQPSPWRTTPIAASRDPTPSYTREQSWPRDQLDPTLEFGKAEPRAVHADRNLDSVDPEIEPSGQPLSPVNREHPLVTPPAASSNPSCSVSLRMSSTRTDLTPPDCSQSHYPDHIARDAYESLAENRVVHHHHSQDRFVNGKGQAFSSRLSTIGSVYDDNKSSTGDADSAIALDSIFSHLSEEQSSSSIISEDPSPDNRVDPAVRDLSLFSREAVGQSRENLQAGSDRYYMGRNSHTRAKSPTMASGSEQPRLCTEDSESVFDTDDDAPGFGTRWEYRRIKARRLDSSGRRMARVEWKDTWEPEDELDGLKEALRRYARERRAKRDSEGTCPKCGAKKRKCPV
ncbi:uncharacterized protein TRUGW13939_11561 [Talaromyces rugulosus]|uniref:Chromo domain-containing protein n=1 Tax=Talaromyces rugulosus TaxID=121627 RepID=A0A7H8RE58_TALRU|nr:uncharacterized protein TRUGW13939_11561 [Talaromyces rugulosus]QKX64387.1 hypothetical protein TRUGW13939_11561 [Talaromyces rugulosus]